VVGVITLVDGKSALMLGAGCSVDKQRILAQFPTLTSGL
jgi:hypothetical protein